VRQRLRRRLGRFAASGHPVRALARYGASLVRRRIPPLRHAIVPYDEGRSRIVADLRTSLGLALYRGEHSDPDIDLVRRLLKPGDTFVDGGASVGLFTLVAAARVGPAGHVLAFEPAPWAFAALSRNLSLNAFAWVEPQAAALGDSPGVLPFLAFQAEGAGFSSFAPESRAGAQEVNVSVVRLDEAVPPPLRANLALIKLDLEGADYRALLGARDLLADSGPDILVEIDPGHLARQGASPEAVLELLAGAGYRAYRPEAGGEGGMVLRELDAWTPPQDSPNVLLTKNPARARAAGVAIAGSFERAET